MSRNDVILGLFALALVGYALVVSLVIPRWRPDFPGSSLRGFVLVSLLVVAAMLATVEVVGEGHDATAEHETATESTEPTETTPTEESGDVAAGETVFTSAGCGSCHTLSAAGSTGGIGPNLDELQPSFDQVVEQVTNGGGAMPPFKDSLSEQQIRDVAAYVVESTRG